MKPFGPVESGAQVLYGLDYRMAAWRGDEENPFHSEVGYWLWDAADGHEVTTIEHARFGAVVEHSDRNVLQRVGQIATFCDAWVG